MELCRVQECRYYHPQCPEATSRSLTAEFKRLDKTERAAVMSVNVMAMEMCDGPAGTAELRFVASEEDQLDLDLES